MSAVRSRRPSLVRLAAAAAGAALVATLGGCGAFETRDALDTVGDVDFATPLPVPPLAEGTERDGVRVFDLEAQAGTTAIVPGGDTETWGFDGAFLGPTLRAHRGESVQVNVRNGLDEATAVHWHGMRLPAAADGGPHQLVEPGETWSPSWTIDQPAATLWYHPHPHGETEPHVYRGLAGLFILDDEEEAGLELPRDYGVDDVPVIVQDKTFDDDGQLVESSRRDNGMLGDTILVNGAAGPVLDVTAERTRLRLLNASTARSFAFGLSDGRELTMIASDGGLLREPVRLSRITLSPGERAEVVVEMDPGETTTLRSYPQELGLSESRSRRTGAADTLDVMLLRADQELAASAQVPERLATVDPLPESDAVRTREFELHNEHINNRSMDMSRIDETVTADTTEVWEVRNGQDQPHNFHIHDVQFQVLGVGGEEPPPELSGWKDTVYLPPGVELKLVIRFGGHADPDMPYMYHCHLLWHEDHGMMGQFVVMEPDQEPGAVGEDHGH